MAGVEQVLERLDELYAIGATRIGYSADLGFVRNDSEVSSAVRAAVDVLADLGAEVDEVDPGFADPVEAFHVLWFSGEAKVLQVYGALDALADRIDAGLARTAALGATYSASDYLDATAVRKELLRFRGTQFDPAILDALHRRIEDFLKVCGEHADTAMKHAA